jgi:hypothetical protein
LSGSAWSAKRAFDWVYSCAAVERGRRRQRLEPRQAGPELRRRAFEHPPAAEREQRIPDEGDRGLGQMIGDVAHRVPADVDHGGLPRTDPDHIAGHDSPVDLGDLGRVDQRGDRLRSRSWP